MKILHVSPSYYPAFRFGGPIQSVHNLNRYLALQGVEVDVFTTNAGLEDRSDIALEQWQPLDGMRVKYFGYYGYVHYNFSPTLLKELFRVVRNYDLVHITAVWNFPVWATAFACHWHKVPYVISPRGTIYPETIALKSTFVKKLYYRLIAEKCLRNASAIHYTTVDERDKVIKYLGIHTPAIVLANGIELQTGKLDQLPAFTTWFPELSGKRYLLFMGRINAKKGLDMLSVAFGKLAVEYDDVRLVIAGPDNEGYAAEIKTKLAENRALDKTLFTGELQGDKKWAAYRDAALFVLSSYSENFGMAVVEAMACGTAVVITDQVGIAPDILNEQAGVVTKTDAESVYRGLKMLLDNPLQTGQLAAQGKKMAAAYYEIGQVAANMKNSYREIIDKKV